MIKITACADVHLGMKLYGKIDPITGLNTREIQTLSILDDIIDYNLKNNIKLFVLAGDAYKNNMPSPTLQDEFNKRIKRASDNGITCLILDGNHDVSKMNSTASALKQFDTLNVHNVIHTRFHKEYIYEQDGEKIKFVFLPTYHTKEEIEDIVKNTKYTGEPIVYIGHMTLTGANLNDWLIADKETYIDKSIFNREGVKAVITGHLHKFQILNSDPLIFYTGSTQTIDFNEENQEKGFVVLTLDNDNIDYEFNKVNSQKFYTFKVDVAGNELATDYVLSNLNTNKIKDSIVRVILNIDEDTKVNDKEIIDYINKYDPFCVLDIQKFYVNKKLVRNAELTENLSVYKSLELYYDGKPRSKERIELGKKILGELNI